MTGETISNSKAKTIFETKRVLITPKLAKETLEFNTKNRRLNPNRVDELAKLMKEGLFQCTHQGIALDTEGNVIDGQHRLAAISKSGCSVYMLVSKGVPDESRIVVDTGEKRSAIAIAKIIGRTNDKASHHAIAKLLQYGPVKYSQMHIPPQIIFKLTDKFSESINFVSTYGKGIHVPILAVVARAYYSKDKERLREFLQVYKSSSSHGEKDVAAIKLRLTISEKYSGAKGGDKYSLTKKYIYQVAESALVDFINEFPTKVIMPTKKEKFPLPAQLEGWNEK